MVEAAGIEPASEQIAGEEHSPASVEGATLSQEPPAGTLVKARPVRVVVSKGGQLIRLPYLAGVTARQASLTLADVGLVAGDIQWAFSDSLPAEIVIATLPEAGTLVTKGSRTWLARPLDYRGLYERTTSAGSLGLSVDGVPGDVPVHLGRIYPHLLHEALVLTSTAMVRRSILGSSVRFTDGVSMFEDWEFHARVARRTVLAFVDYPTTVNRGHRSPERLTLASRLNKAQAYLGLVERVWKADPEFMATRAGDVRRAEGRRRRSRRRRSTHWPSQL